MCTPAAGQIAQAVVSIANTVVTNVNQYQQEKSENKYRAMVAVSKINDAKESAYQERQLGINKAREERIKGIRDANILLAKNASNGFDAMSGTNYQNYDDVIKSSDLQAQNIQEQYEQNADKYFKQANRYLEEYNAQANSYNSKAYSRALNSLGGFSKVASSWYEAFKGGTTDEYI